MEKAETVLRQLGELVAQERASAEHLQNLERKVDETVLEARAWGADWDAIAEALEEPRRRAQWRLQRLRRTSPVEGPPAPRSRQGERQDASAGHEGTMTVTRAAEILGYKSRASIYKLVEEGALEAEISSTGRTRITLESIARRTAMPLETLQEALASEESVGLLEAARRLGVSRTAVARLAAVGELKILEGSTPARITSASLDDYVARGGGIETVSFSEAGRRLGLTRTGLKDLLIEGRLQAVDVPGRSRAITLASVEQVAGEHKK